MISVSKGFFRKITLLAVSGIMVTSLSSCSAYLVISDETKDQGMVVLCSAADVLVGQLKTGGAVAKVAAGIIADNAKDEKIVEIANKVKKGENNAEFTKQLSEYIKGECG